MSRASRHFEEVVSLVKKSWHKVKTFMCQQYQAAASFPPVSFAMSLTERTVGGIWDLVKEYNQENHPQVIRMVQKFIGKIDAVSSTAVRFLDVYVYQVRDLVGYKVNYEPGHVSYHQVRIDSGVFNLFKHVIFKSRHCRSHGMLSLTLRTSSSWLNCYMMMHQIRMRLTLI